MSHLADRAAPVRQRQAQTIEIGRFRAPEPGRMHVEGEAHGFGRGMLLAMENLSVPGDELSTERRRAGELKLQLGAEHGLGQIFGQIGVNEDVAHVVFRHAREHDAAENSAEAPEILILQPRAGGVMVNLHGDGVRSRMDEFGDVEARGREDVLGVADDLTVDPAEEGGLHALEGQHDPVARFALRELEGAVVAAGGIVLLRHFGIGERLVAVPGIEHVGIPRNVIALKLKMSGNLNLRPAGMVAVVPPEALGKAAEILGIEEFPRAVEECMERGTLQLRVGGAAIKTVIRAGIQPACGKYGRILQDIQVVLNMRHEYTSLHNNIVHSGYNHARVNVKRVDGICVKWNGNVKLEQEILLPKTDVNRNRKYVIWTIEDIVI